MLDGSSLILILFGAGSLIASFGEYFLKKKGTKTKSPESI